MQGKATWPGNVHTGSKERGYDFPLDDGLFDNGVDFVLSDATVPDRLPRRSANLKMAMHDKRESRLVPEIRYREREITEIRSWE